jgi:hypothetical protein
MRLLIFILLFSFVPIHAQQTKHEITVSGTSFLLNNSHFPFTGVSFFNAIFNPTFNKSSEERKKWLEKFKKYGINVLRIWGQWDSRHKFVDTCPECSLYNKDGSLRMQHVNTLKAIIKDMDDMGMVVELALFTNESYERGTKFADKEMDTAIANITKELLPFRNITIQIWNERAEFFERVDRIPDNVKLIKSIDPKRVVSNSHGFSGHMGVPEHNEILDYLSPHTSRQQYGKFWENGPIEIEYLLKRYKKPVLDDEPARRDTRRKVDWGGPTDSAIPYDFIIHFGKVWGLGAYVLYHHDMFQGAYGDPTIPPTGIPDPEFDPMHKQVFEFLAMRDRYMRNK